MNSPPQPNIDPLPAILCIHGHGTNSAIFQLQTRRITQSLKLHFRFIFVDAPFSSPPGPGVAPLFNDLAPFLRWHWDQTTADQFDVTPEELRRERQTTRAMLAGHIEAQGGRLAGIMAFSSGTRVATGLMLDEVLGVSGGGALEGIKFAVLICATFPALDIGEGDRLGVPSEKKLAVASIHVQGSADPWVAEGRKLMGTYFYEEMARTVKFTGGHQVPGGIKETAEIAALVMRVWNGEGS